MQVLTKLYEVLLSIDYACFFLYSHKIRYIIIIIIANENTDAVFVFVFLIFIKI